MSVGGCLLVEDNWTSWQCPRHCLLRGQSLPHVWKAIEVSELLLMLLSYLSVSLLVVARILFTFPH